MRRGVVIRVVTVAFFGNGSLSSSAPQAEEPPKSGPDLGANEKKIPVNNRKTTRPIHRDFIALTSVLLSCFRRISLDIRRHARYSVMGLVFLLAALVVL